MGERLRVLLADDHATVRYGLKLLVDAQSDMQVVGEAATGVEAVALTKTLSPTVVVLDISMPEMSGLEAAREIGAGGPRGTAIVALTRYSDDAYLQALLDAGAAGYVLKQSPPAELLAAIRAAAAGKRYLDRTLSARMADAFLARHGRTDTPRRLTDRETDVLRLIATGHTAKDIATRLQVSSKTVDVHKANAMRKLNLRDRVDIVRYAVLQGWLHEV